ncbi:zinc finger protein 638-like [Gouania willdenowi]|uniref:zinc finger protein 638-like n=1 Tax=Gouania willdenowi TaxID=441366 RepID=UPI0010565433|nr:zinc finger protein 638-like [Gouania willdenowi]
MTEESCGKPPKDTRFSLRVNQSVPASGPRVLASPQQGGLLRPPLQFGPLEQSVQAQLNAQFALSLINTQLPSPTALVINYINRLKVASTMSHLYNSYPTDQQSSARARYGHSSAQAQSDPQKTSHPNSGSDYRSAPSAHSPNIPSPFALPLPTFMAGQSRPAKEEEPRRSADLHSDRAREESLLPSRSYAINPLSQGHRKAVAESSDRSLNWLPTYKSTNEDNASKYYTPAASSIFSGGGESRTSAASSIFSGGGESRTSAASSIFIDGGESRTSAASSIFSGGGESRTSAASSIFSGGGESRTSAASSIFSGGGESRTSAASSIFSGGGESRTSAASSIFSGGGESRTSAASSIFPGGGESRKSAASSIFSGGCERKPHEQSIPGLGENEFPVRETGSAQPEFSRRKYTSELASNILQRFGLEKEDLEQLVSYREDQVTPQNLPFILRQIRQQKTKNPVSSVQAVPYPEPKPTTSVSDTDFRGHMKKVFPPDYKPRGILKTSKVIDYGHVSQLSAGPGEEVGMASGAHSDGSSTLLMDSSGREAKEMSMSSLISPHDQESSDSGLDSQLSFKLSSSSLSTKTPPKQFPSPPKQVPQTVSVPFTKPKTDTDSRILPGVSKSLSLKEPEPSQLKSSKPCLSDTPSPSVASGRLGVVVYDSLKDPRQPLKQVSKVPEPKQVSKVPEPKQVSKVPEPKQVSKVPEPKQVSKVPEPKQVSKVPEPKQVSKVPEPKQVSKVPEPKQVSKGPEPKQQQQQPPVKQEGKKQQPAAQRIPTPRVDTTSGVPVPAQMSDYVATTPGMYPHSCSLCDKECLSVKEWINHQNTKLHLENCKLLRKRFPEWDGELPTSLSGSGVDARSSTARPSRSRKKKRSSSSRSRSRSYSPQRYRGSGSRRDQEKSRHRSRSRSRSNSPRKSSRRTCRSRFRSRSQSPLYRSTASRYRSRSRSYERRSSRDDKRPSAKRSRSRERRSSEKLSARQMASGSAEALAQKLLGSSAIQTLSNKSNLEAVVKTLAPALLAEFTKMKTSPSLSSSSSASKKDPKTKTQTVSADDAASTVRLSGVLSSMSHSHLEETARLFGNPTSIVIIRKLKEAQVVFEKPEDAEKMRNAKSHKLMGIRVKSSGGASSESQTLSQERKKAPPKETRKSTTSSLPFKAQNVTAKPAKVPESGKQNRAGGSTMQSSAVKPFYTAAAKKSSGALMKPTVVNKPSQPAKGTTSAPKAPAADKKGSTASEKKAEQKGKEAAVKVEESPDKAENPTELSRSTVVRVLVKENPKKKKKAE